MKLPRHEDEVLKAGARAYLGDDEKVPTTSVRRVAAHGVALSSRYSKAAELGEMAGMVEAVSMHLRPYVSSLFCDSKAGSCYSAEMREDCEPDVAVIIGRQMECAINGHNGIFLVCGADTVAMIDPYWPGDFPEN